MGDPSSEVPLPQSVEQLIHQICIQQNQTPPGADLRRELASIGEEASVQLLRKIASTKIQKNLYACIRYFLKRDHPNSSPSSKNARLSLSPAKIPSSPRTPILARLYGSPQRYILATLFAIAVL